MGASHLHERIGTRAFGHEPGTLQLAGALVRPRLRRRVLLRAAAAALAQERRRMAADVHDLVMQDIAVAVAGARTLLEDPAVGPEAGAVVVAGERALAAARAIVGGLASHDRQRVASVVEASVRDAARQRRLSFDASGVSAGAQADGATCDVLVHIARESVTNAIKHGDPSEIAVVLDREEEWRLAVCDDGCGFDLANPRNGFGLSSMRSAAEQLGGRLALRSAPGLGTTVEASLP